MLNVRLQQWLIETGTSRAELAEKLHVSKRTVDSWLGSKGRPIPYAKHAVIEKIIAPKNALGCIDVNFHVPEEEWHAFTAHLPDHVDKKEYVKNILLAMFKAARIHEPSQQD